MSAVATMSTVATTTGAPRVVLRASGVSKTFGGLKAVQNFALELHAGDLQGLIGPNGAGKTTVFNLLTGVYTPNSGEIVLNGRRIEGMRPFRIAAAGMARTFQNIRLFGELSVLDNVKLASHVRVGTGLFGAMLRSPGHVGEERAIEARARDLLDLFDLDDRRFEQSKNLPYGDQRKLEIARALATGPKVLLLDEPAAGMNPQEKIALRELIRRVRDRFAVSILLIEHDMGVVMELCEKITVLDYGVTIAVGPPVQIQKDPKVIEAYLGTGGEEEPLARVERAARDAVAVTPAEMHDPAAIAAELRAHGRPLEGRPPEGQGSA